MQGIVLIAPRGTTVSEFADVLRKEKYTVEVRSPEDLFLESGSRRIYIYSEDVDTDLDEYNRDEQTAILTIISNPIFYSVDFSDLAFLKEVLCKIAARPDLIIDNDHGNILRGTDFVRRLQENPDWDWRPSSDEVDALLKQSLKNSEGSDDPA